MLVLGLAPPAAAQPPPAHPFFPRDLDAGTRDRSAGLAVQVTEAMVRDRYVLLASFALREKEQVTVSVYQKNERLTQRQFDGPDQRAERVADLDAIRVPGPVQVVFTTRERKPEAVFRWISARTVRPQSVREDLITNFEVNPLAGRRFHISYDLTKAAVDVVHEAREQSSGKAVWATKPQGRPRGPQTEDWDASKAAAARHYVRVRAKADADPNETDQKALLVEAK
jgi:hypothetical protein